MKTYLFSILVLLLLLSCSDESKFNVDGTVAGIPDGKKAILQREDFRLGAIALDTAEIENGKFNFQGNAVEPMLFSIKIEGVPGRSNIILEAGADIAIEIFENNISLNKISGTYHNEELTKFNAGNETIRKQLLDFDNRNRKKRAEAIDKKDVAALTGLQTNLLALRKKVDEELIVASEQYIRSHPDSYVSVILAIDYISRFDNDLSKVTEAYKILSPNMKQTTAGRYLADNLLKANSVEIGEKAPDFSAMTPDGKIVTLGGSVGTVTIVDFWASWCTYCRTANPEMVALYKDYNSKGLKIVGVSLDTQKDRWTGAIATDRLDWTHVSNLKRWQDPIAKLYGVESLPSIFVLNQYGVVVGKNLHGQQLRDKVAGMLK